MEGAQRTWRIRSHDRDHDLSYEMILEEHEVSNLKRLISNAIVCLKKPDIISVYEYLKSIESELNIYTRSKDRIALDNEMKALEQMENDR